MATNWVQPTSVDLLKVISSQLRAKSDENIGDDVQPDQVFNPDLEARGDDIILMVIAQFRGAIQKAGKYPLSLTPNTIPPDYEKHVLNMAAFELVNSTQTLQMVIFTDKGAYAPFQTFYKAAESELEKLRKGYTIVQPSDPTGEDYLTAINVPWRGFGTSPFPTYDSTKPLNRPLRPVRVGSQSQCVDLQSYTSIYGRNCEEWEFPVNEIGQP